MTRTGADAIHYARSRVGPNAMPASGYCLAFVRECFDVASYYASAIDAWNGSRAQHPGDRNPPPAVPLYFRTPSQYDHVVFHGDAGEIITTFNADVRRYLGGSDADVIAQIERDFDGSYLGWTEDINTVTVYAPGGEPVPEPPPIEVQEDDRMELVRILEDGRIMAIGTYQFAQVPTYEEYNALAQIWGGYTDMNIVDADRVHNQVNRNIDDFARSLGQYVPDPAASSSAYEAHRLALLAFVVAFAVLVGAVVTSRTDEVVGLYAGGGALIGGLLVWLLVRGWRTLRGRRGDRL